MDVRVDWTFNAADESKIVGFEVEYKKETDAGWTSAGGASPSERSKNITALQAGETYQFSVFSKDANGATSEAVIDTIEIELPAPGSVTATQL